MEESKRMAIWRQQNPEKDKAQRKRYCERLKADPIRYKAKLSARKTYPSWKKQYGKPKKYSELTSEQKKNNYITGQVWRKNHPEKVKEWEIKARNVRDYGGNRETVIQRDNEQCQECGLTRAEHYKKYKRDITVDHINRLGRGVKNKDNRLENLLTLCLGCHLRKDGRINWKSDASIRIKR
jgi:5-methylcytosine-specific restriction endonuclease McrA